MLQDPLLLRAQALAISGLFDEARAKYNQIIEDSGKTAEVMRGIANLESMVGKPELSIKILEELLEIEPHNREFLFDLCRAFEHSQDFDSALKTCHTILEIAPDWIAARRQLARLFGLQDKVKEQSELLGQLIELEPRNIELRMDYGYALYVQKFYNLAISEFLSIIEINPNHIDALNYLAGSYQGNNNSLEAVKYLEQAHKITPLDHEIAFRLVYNLHQAQMVTRAKEVLQSLSKDSHKLSNYWFQLGNLQNATQNTKEALTSFMVALKIAPNDFILNNNIALCYITLGEIDKALKYFRKSLKHAYRSHSAAAIYSNILFTSQYAPQNSAKKMLKWHLKYEEQFDYDKPDPSYQFRNQRDPNKRLKIGYISDDLVNHPVGFFVSSVIIRHNAEKFESYCYSSKNYEDTTTLRIKSNCHHWRRIHGFSHSEVKKLILDDEIDILVDLSGHTAGNHLVVIAERAAPVQATWAGYIGTTGISTMDWIIADRFHIPIELEYLHRERIMRMPNGYICFEPSGAMLPTTPLPALTNGYITFCSFNNPCKLNPKILSKWAKILHRVPTAKLRLRYGAMGDPLHVDRISKVFRKYKIDLSRLIIENGGNAQSMYRAYQEVDIALDSAPYSGGLTTCEAMWMGVPVITNPELRFASRHSLSHVSNVGLTELVANSWENYIEIAVQLAADLPRLEALRGSLRARVASSPLCDADQFVQDLEAGFRTMWHDWLDRSANPNPTANNQKIGTILRRILKKPRWLRFGNS